MTKKQKTNNFQLLKYSNSKLRLIQSKQFEILKLKFEIYL